MNGPVRYIFLSVAAFVDDNVVVPNSPVSETFSSFATAFGFSFSREQGKDTGEGSPRQRPFVSGLPVLPPFYYYIYIHFVPSRPFRVCFKCLFRFSQPACVSTTCSSHSRGHLLSRIRFSALELRKSSTQLTTWTFNVQKRREFPTSNRFSQIVFNVVRILRDKCRIQVFQTPVVKLKIVYNFWRNYCENVSKWLRNISRNIRKPTVIKTYLKGSYDFAMTDIALKHGRRHPGHSVTRQIEKKVKKKWPQLFETIVVYRIKIHRRGIPNASSRIFRKCRENIYARFVSHALTDGQKRAQVKRRKGTRKTADGGSKFRDEYRNGRR